ncbi:hypothetical protein [Arenibaculum pallidiluteum]|uniref:hypothetical protein n=1 Tax=Arenibaculum pallidiluteum TaxID=2812559 RepID=UPI001A965EC8|nr:hypothetical protein [Arenibaculum pallidiluteum]
MKTLAYSLALVALIGAGSASADDGSTGKNLFIGSTDLTSFMAQEKAPAAPAASVVVDLTRDAGQASVRSSVQGNGSTVADQQASLDDQTDFALTYAN